MENKLKTIFIFQMEARVINVIEFLEDKQQKLIRDDVNILSFVGPISSLLTLNLLPAQYQRQLDENRVNEIIEYQKRIFLKKSRIEIINPIYLTYIPKEIHPFEIIDGQHRFFAYKKLFDEVGDFKIEYKVIICQSQDEAYKYFEMINLSKPLKLQKTREEAEELKKLCDHLKMKYKKWIKSTENPRSPNFNLNHLIEHISKLSLIPLCISKEIDIVSKIDELNSFYVTVFKKNPRILFYGKNGDSLIP